MQFRPLGSFAAAAAAVISLAAPAAAQTPEQFYAGKNIDFVIGYPPGGSNDTLGRLVAPAHRQAHSGQAQRHPEEHAGRRQLPGGQHGVQRLAQGRQRHRHRRAHHAARRAARDPGRALQDRGAQLDRPHRFAHQHGVHVEDVAGADHRRCAEDGIHAVGHRRGLHRLDLSHRAEQRDRHQVQAGHGLQGLERGDARGRARRGRRPLHLLDRAQGRASRLGAGQDGLDPGAVFAQAAPRAARRSHRRRSRPQRRGARDP